MDKFESQVSKEELHCLGMSLTAVQFAQMDVHTDMMEKSMAGAITTSAPEDQIEALMKQVRRG